MNLGILGHGFPFLHVMTIKTENGGALTPRPEGARPLHAHSSAEPSGSLKFRVSNRVSS